MSAKNNFLMFGRFLQPRSESKIKIKLGHQLLIEIKLSFQNGKSKDIIGIRYKVDFCYFTINIQIVRFFYVYVYIYLFIYLKSNL